MNKKYGQYVPIIIFLAIALGIFIIVMGSKDKIIEYTEAIEQNKKDKSTIEQLEKDISSIEATEEQEKLKLQSLKPIYESEVDSTSENLGIYGNMFEDIVRRAQRNGLMIRSIEYNLHPENDPLIIENADTYNACELKFFFVGSYSQLQAFLTEMNSNFPHLTYISKLSVTAFTQNTDYLLINTAITLYSKKTEEEQSRAVNNKRRNR